MHPSLLSIISEDLVMHTLAILNICTKGEHSTNV